MANYDQTNYNNWNTPQGQHAAPSYNFDMPEQFGGELNFQSFDTSQSVDPSTAYSGSFYDPNAYAAPDPVYDAASTDFDNEPPLLEVKVHQELICFSKGVSAHLYFDAPLLKKEFLKQTLSVLNPFRTTDQMILQDTDLAGPLVFCLTLGSFLLLSGKVHFSYIYGIGVMGCIAFYALLSVMATQSAVTLGAVVSVLGYCLLPMVVLSGINILVALQGAFGIILAGLCIVWCSMSASKLFVTAYSMDHQQILIAYPCALLYGVFALITIF